MSRQLLTVSGAGDSTTSLGNLFQCSVTLHSEKLFPDVRTELPVFQFVPTASGPVPGHHWKEPGSVLLGTHLCHCSLLIPEHWRHPILLNLPLYNSAAEFLSNLQEFYRTQLSSDHWKKKLCLQLVKFNRIVPLLQNKFNAPAQNTFTSNVLFQAQVYIWITLVAVLFKLHCSEQHSSNCLLEAFWQQFIMYRPAEFLCAPLTWSTVSQNLQ